MIQHSAQPMVRFAEPARIACVTESQNDPRRPNKVPTPTRMEGMWFINDLGSPGADVKVWAVEKNPNAVVTLRRYLGETTRKQVEPGQWIPPSLNGICSDNGNDTTKIPTHAHILISNQHMLHCFTRMHNYTNALRYIALRQVTLCEVT